MQKSNKFKTRVRTIDMCILVYNHIDTQTSVPHTHIHNVRSTYESYICHLNWMPNVCYSVCEWMANANPQLEIQILHPCETIKIANKVIIIIRCGCWEIGSRWKNPKIKMPHSHFPFHGTFSPAIACIQETHKVCIQYYLYDTGAESRPTTSAKHIICVSVFYMYSCSSARDTHNLFALRK